MKRAKLPKCSLHYQLFPEFFSDKPDLPRKLFVYHPLWSCYRSKFCSPTLNHTTFLHISRFHCKFDRQECCIDHFKVLQTLLMEGVGNNGLSRIACRTTLQQSSTSRATTGRILQLTYNSFKCKFGNFQENTSFSTFASELKKGKCLLSSQFKEVSGTNYSVTQWQLPDTITRSITRWEFLHLFLLPVERRLLIS